MSKTDTPAKVASNDRLGLAQDRAAFDRLVLQLTGRDMDYHNRNGTTGLDTAWICYRGGVAAERERCAPEIERLRDALLIGHTYAECCPTPASPDDRDQDCPACAVLGPNVLR